MTILDFNLGWAPHRHVTTYNQLRKHALKKKNLLNYSSDLCKSSPTRLVNEKNARNGTTPFDARQFENMLAAEQIRQSNEILKEHYLKRRRMLKTLAHGVEKPIPKFTKKLQSIMGLDIESTDDTVSSNIIRTSDCYQIASSRDDKYEISGEAECSHIKVPKRRQQNSDEEDSIQPDDYPRIRRTRKAARLVKSRNCKILDDFTQGKYKERLLASDRDRVKKMWQIGEWKNQKKNYFYLPCL